MSSDDELFALAVQEEPLLAGLAPDRVRQAFDMLQHALPPKLSIDNDDAAEQASAQRLHHTRDIAVALEEGGQLAADEVLQRIIDSETTTQNTDPPSLPRSW